MEAGNRLVIVTSRWNGGTDVQGDPTMFRVADSYSRWARIGRIGDAHYWTLGRSMARAVERSDVDVAISLMPLSTARRLAREVPLVTFYHHLEGIRKLSHIVTRPVHRLFELHSSSYSSLLIAPSQYTREQLVRVLGADPSRIRVVPEAVSPRFLGNPRRPSNANGPALILTVASLERRKGIGTLMRALSRLRNEHVEARLEIIGSGEDQSRLELEMSLLGLDERVTFRGHMSDNHLLQALGKADIFALPSLQEGFSQVLLEAMASWLPVVASDVSAIPETVGHAGILVPPGDARSLASALRLLIEDPARRQEMGRKGRERVEALFTWDKVLPRLMDVYREAIDLKGQSS